MQNDKSIPKDAIALIEEMAKLRKQNALILSTPGSNHGKLVKNSTDIIAVLRKAIDNNYNLFTQDLIAKLIEIYKYDYSISESELGNLFKQIAEGNGGTPLHKGMQWIARQHHASLAFPSTSGTTALNCMMVATLVQPDETVLIQRDSHTSLLSGIIQAGAKVDYINPCYQHELGLSFGISPAALEKKLQENPDIRAVILTYPNYFGIATDILQCAAIVRKYGKRFGIDSAHGAYLAHHPALPVPASEAHADIVTMSNHKTNATLGQGSIALLQENPSFPELMTRWYEVANQLGYITTSFSYPILASILLGEILLWQSGQEDIEEAIVICNRLRRRIHNELSPLTCLRFDKPEDGFHQFDPLRVAVDVSKLGLTGFEVADCLNKEAQIYPEMETLNYVLFLFSPYDTLESTEAVFTALEKLLQKKTEEIIPYLQISEESPQIKMNPRAAFYAPSNKKRYVNVSEADGFISAETISCYPPGSAVIVAGEVITDEAIKFLSHSKQRGCTLKGISDLQFEKIQIIEL